jgi:hypothetical protein
MDAIGRTSYHERRRGKWRSGQTPRRMVIRKGVDPGINLITQRIAIPFKGRVLVVRSEDEVEEVLQPAVLDHRPPSSYIHATS